MTEHTEGVPSERGAGLSPIKRALLAVDEMKAKLDAVEHARTEPIAVVGIGCRFPGADGPKAYWQLLRDGVNAVGEVPRDRWNIDEYFDADPATPGKMYTKWAGFLDRVDMFDPQFFGIAPREAVGMDPQQRLLLEVCWEALEHAGQRPDGLHGSPTGVFLGMVACDYATLQTRRNDLTAIDAYSQSGLSSSIASGRVSYVLGLQGPSMTVDTACSSSLVAVHLAVQSLRLGECRMALAAGVHLILLPDNSVCYSRARMLAADGRCKAFDASADGFVEGEGCGVVVLKRLSEAIGDGDRIYAVIRGSAVNQDGPSGGLTVPNGPSQEAVVRDALARGGVDPMRIGLIEAHGTGTSLGDPIEARALASVFGPGRASSDRVALGSVKTNIGHLQGAAGIAGFIKLVLSLHHEAIPPHLHFATPSPHIPWDSLPLTVPTTLAPWPRGAHPRAGGVSAFGFSGTNAHVVVEEAPASAAGRTHTTDRPSHILTLSARSEPALHALAGRWAGAVDALEDPALPDVCFTANTGRAQLPYRAAMTAASRSELVAQLQTLATGGASPSIARGLVNSSDRPKVAFLFTGQGAQYPGMGRRLFETHPVFRDALERCDAALRPHLERPLLAVMYPEDAGDRAVDETVYTQPALFSLEYALAELWRSWGVTPTAVLGHSLGEYVAATVAGVFALDRALELVATRARLMQSLPAGGSMAAVLTDEATVASGIAAEGAPVAIAAVNGPRQVVISGPAADVAAVVSRLAVGGVGVEPLVVSHAFHSSLMEPILDAFATAVRAAQPAAPSLAVVSNLTGQVVRHELADPGYWQRHLREPVRFADGIATLHGRGYRTFVELGPKPVLSAMGQRCVPDSGTWLPCLRQGRDDWQQMLAALRELHVRGVDVDWDRFDRPYARRRVALPTYPFERSRYWVNDEPSSSRAATAAATSRHPLLGDALRTAPGPVVFAGAVSAEALPYLADHRKHGAALFPATAYLEMGLAAAADVFGPGAHRFDDLMISSPLVLPESAPVDIQVVVTPDGSEAAFQFFSREADETGSWTLHATGTLRKSDGTEPTVAPPDLTGLEGVDAAGYYAGMAIDGHEYGPAFQAIRELWRGTDRATGRLELAAADIDQAGRYRLHPVLLDAATQMIGAALPVPGDQAERDTYLPVTLERLTVYSSGAARGWGEVRVRQADASTRTLAADVRLIDEAGRVIAVIEGMYLKPLNRAALTGVKSAVGEWLHEIGWAPAPLESPTALAPERDGKWVVFADETGIGQALVRQLRAGGHRCAVVMRGDGGFSAGEVAADALRPDDVREAYRRAAAGESVAGILYLWALDAAAPDGNPDPLAPGAPGGCAGLLHVVQAVTAEHETERPRLWVITGGAQPVDGVPVAVEQAATLGLARSITAEHPDLRCVCVDLPPSGDVGAHVRLLADEIGRPDAEEQVAYRGDGRYAARLRHISDRSHDVEGPVALDIGTRGLLDTLTLQSATRRPPGPGEVEVRVIAAGLNFRDVLNALGMYEGPAGALGSEFVGAVVARGGGVTVEVGSVVMGMAGGAFRTHLCVPADTVAPVPAGLRAEEAATLPVVFLTALHGLERLADLRAGERVLIHAGTGGVGLAAIQVARRLGAEIFATAGSDEKRDYLRRLGVQHVFSSRTLEFGDQIRAATGGAGVDVILNSLNGDFISESVGVLGKGGRFVEIGKAGIWTAEQMSAARPDVRYFPLYLGDVGPATLRQLYDELRAAIAAGDFRPLPFKIYPLEDARQAFRFMAQARHIGKLVLSAPIAADATSIRPDATYLITGAFGGLGAQVARWLVVQGARHLSLVGRQGAAAAGGAALVSDLEALGASVHAHAADVADAAAMARVFGALDPQPPLRGVIHAAGVLDDGVLQQQSVSRLSRVFGPKVRGAWLLHQHTQDRPLDFFVMFSSMVTVVGAPGQGNYAAANATLDALAHYRRAQGLPALTINWGPWSEAGMSAGVSQQDRQRWQRQGIRFIGGEQGLAALGRLIRGASPQVAVLPIQWRVLFQQFPAGSLPPLYSELSEQFTTVATGTQSADVDLMTLVREVPAARVRSVVVRHITELAFKVLGLDDATVVDSDRPLQEYGLDSLMAVELRNALGGLVGRTLPATVLFKYPTVQALADHVLESVPTAQGAAAPEVDSSQGADVAEIGSMSDDEVKRMLAEELAILATDSDHRDGSGR